MNFVRIECLWSGYRYLGVPGGHSGANVLLVSISSTSHISAKHTNSIAAEISSSRSMVGNLISFDTAD